VEQPILRLGLLGFTESDKQHVLNALAQQSTGWPCWELVDFELADAWCINGREVECLEGNAVRVNTLLPYSPTISLNPAEITRPIAFTQPMPEGIEAAEIIDFRSQSLTRAVLQRFEAWLRPLRAQFALGSEMVARESELIKGIYHLLDAHGKLLAVINLVKWTASLLPMVRPVDFDDANWVLRPNIAGDIPPGFITLPVAQLMWTYAVRTTNNVLPPRYRTHKIFLRRIPQLPSGWLRDAHLVTLRALSMAPGEFSDIQAATDLPKELLARTLAALYYAGAVTTNKAMASHLERPRSPAADQSSLPPDSNMFAAHSAHSAHGSLHGNDQQRLHLETDPTDPIPLLNPK
jgi:hypothetical protein